MVLSFLKLLLVVVTGQLCLSTAFVIPFTSTPARSTSFPPGTFLPSSVLTADNALTTCQQQPPNLPFVFSDRAALSTQSPPLIAVRSTTLPKLHLHIEDSELGDMVDIVLEMRELFPEPSVLASMGKLLEVALLQMSN